MSLLQSLRSEPYRLLFPLGLAFAAIGLGVWIPFRLSPRDFPYPGQGHAMVQIQGFMLCFVLGFLGTMLPKVLGIRPMGPVQFTVLPVGLIALVAFALAGMPRAAQLMHLVVVADFLLFVARRFPDRAGPPPPPFVFIALAMAADVAGTGLRLLPMDGRLGGAAQRAGQLLQYQAFSLLLVLGVGSFLLPKLFARAAVTPETLSALAGGPQARRIALGLVFLATCALEAFGPLWLGTAAVRAAYAARAGIWAWFLFGAIGLHRVARAQPAYLQGARLSLWSILAGLALPVLWPAWLLAWEHVVFIGGLLWLTLSIAARVVTAHGGRLDLLETSRRHRYRILAYGVLVAMALLVRVATDIWIETRWLHLAIASMSAMGALVLWAWSHAPLFFRFPGSRPA